MALFPPAPLGGEQVAHGYKGKGVLSHLLSDAQGHPLAWMSTAANGDERLQVQPLLQKSTLIYQRMSTMNLSFWKLIVAMMLALCAAVC